MFCFYLTAQFRYIDLSNSSRFVMVNEKLYMQKHGLTVNFVLQNCKKKKNSSHIFAIKYALSEHFSKYLFESFFRLKSSAYVAYPLIGFTQCV